MERPPPLSQCFRLTVNLIRPRRQSGKGGMYYSSGYCCWSFLACLDLEAGTGGHIALQPRNLRPKLIRVLFQRLAIPLLRRRRRRERQKRRREQSRMTQPTKN